MEHHFSVELAEQYGILEAVLLNHLYFWITKNEANDRNYHDGYYWTYNSARAYQELFPYASERKIRTALKHLEEEEIIITGNYNSSAYDRTTWYALTKKGTSILQNRQMEVAKTENGSSENVTPIPNNIPNNKTDKKTKIPPTIKEVQDYCRERKNNINAEQFIDYYESKGWLVGKTKMKDWRAAVRTWERNGFSNPPKSNSFNNYDQRDTDYSKIEKMLMNKN